MWVARARAILFYERGVIGSQRPGNFCLLVFFVGMIFHTKKNQPYTRCSLLQSIKSPPPQVHHELTCSQNCRGGEDEEAEQDENWGGVYCKSQGWRLGEDHNGGKKQ